MCDHCGCRELTPIARLMGEHDRLRELTGAHPQRTSPPATTTAARAHFEEFLVVLGPHVSKEEGFLFPMLAQGDGPAPSTSQCS